MTKRFAPLALFLSLAFFATSGFAQPEPATPALTAEPLAPFAWMVGGTWVTDVKNPSDGTLTHVESHMRWAPNHQAIDFNTDFNGKPHYNGFYAYNPVTQAISFYYTSSQGDLTIGTATPDPDGKTLPHEFDILHADGKTEHVRSTVVRDGNDAYWFSVFVQKDGEWAQLFKIRYERK